jgi:hypothetical protein
MGASTPETSGKMAEGGLVDTTLQGAGTHCFLNAPIVVAKNRVVAPTFLNRIISPVVTACSQE